MLRASSTNAHFLIVMTLSILPHHIHLAFSLAHSLSLSLSLSFSHPFLSSLFFFFSSHTPFYSVALLCPTLTTSCLCKLKYYFQDSRRYYWLEITILGSCCFRVRRSFGKRSAAQT